MALFIRDAHVEALAEEVRKLTRTKSKTEAVRHALQTQLSEARRALPLRQRLERAKALADAMGASAPSFDMKTYTGEQMGGRDDAREATAMVYPPFETPRNASC